MDIAVEIRVKENLAIGGNFQFLRERLEGQSAAVFYKVGIGRIKKRSSWKPTDPVGWLGERPAFRLVEKRGKNGIELAKLLQGQEVFARHSAPKGAIRWEPGASGRPIFK